MPSGIACRAVVRFLNGKFERRLDGINYLGSPKANLYGVIYSKGLRENYPGVDLAVVNHRIIKLSLCPDCPDLVEADPHPAPPSRLFAQGHDAGAAKGSSRWSCCLSLDSDFLGTDQGPVFLGDLMATGLTQ